MNTYLSNLHVFPYEEKLLGIDATTLSRFEISKELFDLIQGKHVEQEIVSDINKELTYYVNKGFFINDNLPETMESYLSTYNISIQNTLECPLDCKYCFAKKVKSNVRKMSEDTAEEVVNFIFDTFDDMADGYELYFTSGGEPLTNFPIIKQIYKSGKLLAKEKLKTFRLGFTTNSILLDDEKLEYLNDSEIGLMLSIDGKEEEHDLNRQFLNGKGSYQYVLECLDKLKKSKNDYLNHTQALTVLTNNSKSYLEIYMHLVDLGFKKVNLKLVRNTDIQDPQLISKEITSIKSKYSELIQFITNEIIQNNWKYVIPILDQNNMLGQTIINVLLKKKVVYRCDAGKSKFSILPNGDIYPCDFFSSIPEAKMGDIYKGINGEKRKNWFKQDCTSFSECNGCWARYVCAGTCYYSRYINGGKADATECEIIRFLIEQVIGMFMKIECSSTNTLKHLTRIVKNVKKNTHNEE